MHEEGVAVSIGGREYRMVFTLAALLAVKKQYGGLQEMVELFNGPTINDWDSEEEQLEKLVAQEKAQMDALDHLPWLLSTLINQGELLKDPKAELVTPEYIALRIMPRDMQHLMGLFEQAIALGMSMEHTPDEGKRDPVLEELDAKNGEGAGVG
ncbi:MAG: hypothetical protein GX650_08320 [Clostridiales bacterium]|nr:hypothetical protein [Clostridiales bacterium]